MNARTASFHVLLFALLFAGLGLLLIPGVGHYHIDEQWYTDAALNMERSGDYLNPRWADGTPRYRKPVLAYWAVLAGFRLFGTNYFGARILFLLAGVATVVVTYRLARQLFGGRPAAVTATMIAASNQEIWVAALRSTPDIWLTLFVTLSFSGFAGVLFRRRESPVSDVVLHSSSKRGPVRRATREAWIAWPAAGLATATKGLFGPLVPAWALLFAWWRSRRGAMPLEPLLALAPIAAGALLAAAWYGSVWLANGSSAIDEFYVDQIGMRAGAPALQVLENAGYYLSALFRDFLPWWLLIVPALVAAPGFLNSFWKRHREPILFVAGWYGVLLVILSAALMAKSRYFLPAPLAAAVVGAFTIEALEEPRIAGRVQPLRVALPLLGALVGAVTIGLGAFIDVRIFAAGIVWAGAALVFAWLARRASAIGQVATVAAWLLLAVGGYDVLVRPALSVSPAPEFTRRLTELGVGRDDLVTFEVANRELAQIRVLSKGAIWPRMAHGSTWEGGLDDWDGTDPLSPYVLVRGRFREPLQGLYDFEPFGWTYRQIHTKDVLEMVRRGRKEMEPELRVSYFLGTRRVAGAPR